MRSICDLKRGCDRGARFDISQVWSRLHAGIKERIGAGVVLASILLFALSFRMVASYSNYGFLALDDYYLISTSVPAQVAEEASLQVDRALIRSPVPILFVHATASLAYRLGLADPVDQIRFVYLLLGAVSLLTVYFAARIFQTLGLNRAGIISASLISFHFLFPYISTRALLESMSAPFLVVSLFFMVRYWMEGGRRFLASSIIWLGVASLFRYQVGIVAITVPAIVYLRNRVPDHTLRSNLVRSLPDHGVVLIAGTIALILTGLPDLLMRGEFHGSLIEYVKYNLAHSSSYGVRPFWSYLPILIGASLAPFYISAYRGFDWKGAYRPLLPAILYFGIFVLAHSAIPHKEERFLIPILPVLMILLVPITEHLLFEKRANLRMGSLLIVNLLLLPFVTISLSQSNTIGLVRYFNDHHEATRLLVFEKSLEHLPISYALRPRVDILLINSRNDAERLIPTMSCGDIMAVRRDLLPLAKPFMDGLVETIRFEPGPLEKMAIALSPRSNLRREAILGFQSARCGVSGRIVTVNERRQR